MHNVVFEREVPCSAYLDNINNKVYERAELRAVITELRDSCETFNVLRELDLTPLFDGNGTDTRIGRECSGCGAPLNKFADSSRYVALGTCSDCREG
jgi:hypothetical protein